MSLSYQKSIEFNASKEQVWDALTNPAKTKQYMYGCEVISNWNVGDPIIWKGLTEDGQEIIYVKGEITAIDPGNSVSFSMFDPNMGLQDVPENYVYLTYTLSSQGETTSLHLDQGDYSSVENGQQRYEDTIKGWEYVYPLMRKVIE